MSTYRRSQLEKDLPEASPNLCAFLWRHLSDVDMNVPQADVAFIGKLVSAYIKGTPEGKQTALKLLNCEPKPVSALQTYFRASAGSRHEDAKIKPRDLMEFKGWIYKGTNCVKWESIDIDEREDASVCDNCGGRYPVDYCMKQIESTKKTGEMRIEQWCNHCRFQTDDPRVRSTGDQRTCGACEKVTCEFHPKHHVLDRPVALLPQRAASSNDAYLPPGWSRP